MKRRRGEVAGLLSALAVLMHYWSAMPASAAEGLDPLRSYALSMCLVKSLRQAPEGVAAVPAWVVASVAEVVERSSAKPEVFERIEAEAARAAAGISWRAPVPGCLAFALSARITAR